jgi:type VI secretion system protein ImpA
MATVNLEGLLSETKDAPPCGPNLEHDLSYFELEEAARAKPEQRFGDAVKPAEEPNWPKVIELTQALLARTKDLRVAAHLTRALTRTEGIPGLAAGLALVHGLLERYWDPLHPLLDAEQDGDPTERINALGPLADPDAIIRDLRDADLVRSREHGQLQAREVEVALGRLGAPRTAGAKPKALGEIHGQIAAAFASDRTIPTALRTARTHVQSIQTLVAERVGSDRGVDLKPLAQCLDCLIETCDAALGTSTPEAGPAPVAGSADDTAGIPRPAMDGEIRTREDALRMLDRVCSYLERHEPSNPAPLFIRRAQRLMTKSFVEIVKDLIPDSLANLEKLAGEAMEKKK